MRIVNFFAITVLLYLSSNQLLAQQNGYFGTWEKDSGITQVSQEVDSFDEWKTLTEQNGQNGFIPTDFEAYQVNGIDKYFGVWQSGTGNDYWWYYWTSIEDWMNTNNDLVENQGAVLVDFEVYQLNGKNMYFGIWQTGNKEQQIKITNTIQDLFFANLACLNDGLRLVNFEKYTLNEEDQFLGVWQKGTGKQEMSSVGTHKKWIELHNKFVREEGLELTDFEKYESDGKNWYFGVWQSGSGDQQTIVVNNLEDWTCWNDHLVNNQNFVLKDFEKFEDEIINLVSPPEKIITNEDLISDVTYNWYKDTTYLLKGIVKLETAGILNIEAGTLIKALPAAEGVDFAGLFIEPGAKIFAKGTQENPIIFTAYEDDIEQEDSFGESIGTSLDVNDDRGRWFGLSIAGDGLTSSGELSYTSIRYAGKIIEGSINAGLSLVFVKSTTNIHHVEVFASASDGIQIIGGDVNLHHISVAFISDDAYDWDFGWVGNGIYWFSYQGTKSNNLKTYSIEGKANVFDENTPISNPRIYNSTFIGTFCDEFGVSNSNNEAAIIFMDNSAGRIANSVIVDFPQYGLQIEDLPSGTDSRQQMENNNLQLWNNIWWNFGAGNEFSADGMIKVAASAEDKNASFLVEHLGKNDNIIRGNGVAANGLCFNLNLNYFLDPHLDEQSGYDTLLNASYPNNSFYAIQPRENQKGAFSDEELWLKDWTILSQYISLGENAEASITFGDTTIKTRDTIRIQCEDLIEFQDSMIYYHPCGPGGGPLGQIARASRKGGRKRPSGRSIPEDGLSFIEDWVYSSSAMMCNLENSMEIVVLVYDTTAPIIHPIPDKNGQLTAFVEDCDEAWLTDIIRDTQRTADGLCISHLFKATDYTGNTSELLIEEKLNVAAFDTLYADIDGDGFGNPDLPILWLGILDGFIDNNLDCNDNNDVILNDCPFGIDGDICKGASEIAINTDCSFSFDGDFLYNRSPTIWPYLSSSCGIPRNFRDVWFKTKLPSSGNITIELENGQFVSAADEFVVVVYKGTCTKLEFVDCEIGDSGLSMSVKIEDIGQDSFIYLRIMESGNIEQSNFTICILEQTPISTAINEVKNDNKIVIFPNPIARNKEVLIQLDLEKRMPISLWLLDIQGKQQRTILENTYQEAGQSYIKMETGNLPTGIYFFQLRTQHQLLSKKLIIIE